MAASPSCMHMLCLSAGCAWHAPRCSARAPPVGVKVVVVVRDPRDVMVSLYYHSRALKGVGWEGTWDQWFDSFLDGTVPLPMTAAAAAMVAASTLAAVILLHALTQRCEVRVEPLQLGHDRCVFRIIIHIVILAGIIL